MSQRETPIVPHVLLLEELHPAWQMVSYQRCEALYQTPTTVRIRMPDGSEASKQQQQLYCLPDADAWQAVNAAAAAHQVSLDNLANQLRLLGTYSAALRSAGGIDVAPNPLVPSVIWTYNPVDDGSADTVFQVTIMPFLQRQFISGHTSKMLREATHDGLLHQRNHYVCPTDADWQVIEACRAACEATAEAWRKLLTTGLRSYSSAVGLGLYGQALVPTAAAPVTSIVMMDEAEARETMQAIRTDLDAAERAEHSARQRLLDWREREGWRALGHDSFVSGVQAEFKSWSKSYISRLVGAAQVERLLPTGNEDIPERQLRELLPLLDQPEAVRVAWETATTQAAAEGKPRTAKHVAAAAAPYLPTFEPDLPEIASDDDRVVADVRMLLPEVRAGVVGAEDTAYNTAARISIDERRGRIFDEIDTAVEFAAHLHIDAEDAEIDTVVAETPTRSRIERVWRCLSEIEAALDREAWAEIAQLALQLVEFAAQEG